MNKSDLIDRVAEKAELTRAVAARVVDAIFDTAAGAISEAVHVRGFLSIPGFGRFTKRKRAARSSRNPRTGLEIQVPERSVIVFRAGKGLRRGEGAIRRRTPGAARTARTRAAAVAGVAGAGRSAAARNEARIRELAIRVWEDEKNAEEFLNTPHPMLDGKTPLKLARTPEGYRRVTELLLKLEYGLPA
ncbi:MAG: HU family DNA-binding protein [Longimicrobiaceae bacterium]